MEAFESLANTDPKLAAYLIIALLLFLLCIPTTIFIMVLRKDHQRKKEADKNNQPS